MTNMILAPVGLFLLLGSMAVLVVVYAALVISARTDAMVRGCELEGEASSMGTSQPRASRGVFRPSGHIGPASA